MGISITGGVKVPQGKFSVQTAAGFSPSAADFDGSDDRLFHSGALSTITDGKQGLVSVWFKPGISSASGRIIHLSDVTAGDAAKLDINITAGGLFSVVGRTAGGAVILNLKSVNTFTTVDVWVHAMASWDLGAGPITQMYTNDVSDISVTTETDGIINYSYSGNTSIGADADNLDRLWNGCLGEFYFTNEFLNLDDPDNRAKFISGGLPIDLGADGSTPTETPPILYFSGDSSAFPTNLGSGGSFSVEGGGLATCEDSPSVA